MARLGSFKAGGGFLNNVDGLITGYEFTTEFPMPEGRVVKKKGKSDFNPLYFVLSARADGAEEDVKTTLFAGSADDFEITENGHVLEPLAEGGALRQGTSLYTFLESMIEHEFPEDRFPEDPSIIDFRAIIGTRVTFVQVPDKQAEAKGLGKRKGKDGKEYNRTTLAVSQVLALPAEGGGKPSKGGKPAPGKPGKAAVADDTDELNDTAVAALLAVLEDEDGQIAKSKLTVKGSQKIGMKHPQAAALRKLIVSDEFLATEQGWTYNAKKGIIATA